MSFFPVIPEEYRKMYSDTDDAQSDTTVGALAKNSQQYIDLIDINHSKLLDSSTYRKSGLAYSEEEVIGKKVAVIGAGISGLISAFELWRQGALVDIYEAQTRPGSIFPHGGGRLHSVYLDNPNSDNSQSIVEMGAMRFPNRSTCLWKFLRNISELQKAPIINENTKVQPFPNPVIVPTGVLLNGEFYTTDKDHPLPSDITSGGTKFINALASISYKVHIGPKTINANLAYVSKVLKIANPSQEQITVVSSFWESFIGERNDMSFKDFLTLPIDQTGAGLDDTELHNFYYIGLGTGGFGPLYPIALTEIFRLIAWDYSVEYKLPIASSQIASLAYSALDKNNLINPPKSTTSVNFIDKRVSNIRYNKDGARKVFISTEGGISDAYDAAIVATSHREYQFLGISNNGAEGDFEAIFPHKPQLIDAIKTLHSLSASKIFVTAPAPWNVLLPTAWPHINDKPIKVLLSDTLAMQSYFIPDDEVPQEENVTILLSYLWGDEARKNQANIFYPSTGGATSEWVKLVSESFKQYNDTVPMSSFLNKYVGNISKKRIGSIVWENEPYIHSAFKLPYPGETLATRQLAFQFDMAEDSNPPLVFLAGESCSYAGGWVEGAIISALNASSATLKALGAKLIPEAEALFQKRSFK